MARKGTRKDFVEWLRSKKPREIVGVRKGAWVPCLSHFGTYCPLGEYHKSVGIGTEGEIVVRAWHESFAQAVDKSGSALSGVTAHKALQLLGEDA